MEFAKLPKHFKIPKADLGGGKLKTKDNGDLPFEMWMSKISAHFIVRLGEDMFIVPALSIAKTIYETMKNSKENENGEKNGKNRTGDDSQKRGKNSL